MAAGKINLQAADGAVIGLVVPNGLTSGERQIALGANLSGITAYHLLQGNLAVSNSTITQGFNTTLYTGNGTTQAVNTGIDMDTQWGDTTEEKFGGLVWIKSRSIVKNNHLVDTIRGVGQDIYTDLTLAQTTEATGLTAFSSTGFSLGTLLGVNTSSAMMASWNFQTTHRVTGTTNHGKAYTCHYNPFTGFTIVKYEGSGIAGHEIPHHLGRKLAFANFKNLTTVQDWLTYYGVDSMYMAQNLTIAGTAGSVWSNQTDTAFKFDGGGTQYNQASSQHIMYGWANSYFDESNKLIGNYELVTYQGTGVAGNKVKTRGKPAWVMVKRLDSTGNWVVFDNQRGNSDYHLYANLSNAEGISVGYGTDFYSDGFAPAINGAGVAWIDTNVSGGQYIALVAYDTNANGGGSYYPLASDTANVQINNALIPLAQGIDGNGVKNTILSKNETITGLTYAQGKNYVYCDKNGSYGVTPYKPRYLESELVRTFASEAPEYYDVGKNKWFSTSGHGELVTNGTFDSNTTGWTAVNGAILSVVDGALNVLSGTTDYACAVQEVTVDIGKRYRVKVRNVYNSVTKYYSIEDANGVNIKLVGYEATTNTENVDIIVTAQTNKIRFRLFAGSVHDNAVSRYDNISIFPVDIVPTTEIPEGRNYLNHIVHADNDGGVLYVEELPKTQYFDRIETGNNRKVMYLADYGISQIQNNKRYVLDNPFGNGRYMDCDAKLEILTTDGYWVELSHSQSQNGSGSAYSGAKAFSTQVGIVIQTGLDGFTFNPANCHIVPFAVTNTTLAQARVTIQFNGRTGRTV